MAGAVREEGVDESVGWKARRTPRVEWSHPVQVCYTGIVPVASREG